tara:strand:+ start:151 stop:540 length:390 start_codon:yes stop_codon:yes gene_type:complete
MNTIALDWYRNNVNFTEGKGLIYYDTINFGGIRRFMDKSPTNGGMNYFGTPGEYGANFQAAKYISLVSSPDKGKVFYTDYEPKKNITKEEVFPGGNNKLDNNTSPYHMIKLYFPNRTSLGLNKNTKIWT